MNPTVLPSCNDLRNERRRPTGLFTQQMQRRLTPSCVSLVRAQGSSRQPFGGSDATFHHAKREAMQHTDNVFDELHIELETLKHQYQFRILQNPQRSASYRCGIGPCNGFDWVEGYRLIVSSTILGRTEKPPTARPSRKPPQRGLESLRIDKK